MAPALPQSADSPSSADDRLRSPISFQGSLQRGDEVSHAREELRGGAVLLDEADDGGPHDDAVSGAADLGGLLRGTDAEAHADRLGRDIAQGAQLLGALGSERPPAPRGPGG